MIAFISSTQINRLLQLQLGKSLHEYKKVAANKGVLFDSGRLNEVREKLRTKMKNIQEYSHGVSRINPTRSDLYLGLRCALITVILYSNSNNIHVKRTQRASRFNFYGRVTDRNLRSTQAYQRKNTTLKQKTSWENKT